MARNSRVGYGLTEALSNLTPTPIVAQRAPLATDTAYEIGTTWIRSTTNQAWILTSVVAGAASWVLSSPGASDVDTINALPPVLGNINVVGGVNITESNGGNTVSLALDPAITLATSVTSPIYASAAAMDINVAAGSNITIQMGDAAGANVVEFEDSASAAVATIDSNGIATFVGMDGVLGGVTPAAATGTTITANTSVTSPLYTAAASDALIQAGGVNDVVVRLGDAAGATFFRVQDSATADVWTVDSNGTFAAFLGLTVTGAFAQTAGTFNVGQDNAANAINIGAGNVARAITIGAGAGAHTVDIGSAAAGAIAIDTAAGISLDAATLSNVTVTGAGADLNMGSVGGSVDLTASEAAVDAIDIQATDAAGGINVDCGSGGFDLLATAGAFSIDGQLASNITVTSTGLDLSLEGVGCAVNVTSTQAENDAILIEASDAVGGVQIRAGTGGILIGNEADTQFITLGLNAATVARIITIGGGTMVTAATTDYINIAPGGATTNANSIKQADLNCGGVTLGEVLTNIATGAVTSGTHTTSIATGNRAAGTMTLDMLTGTGTKIANLGNADAATTLNIDAITLINDSVNAATSINTGTSTGAVAIGNALSGAVTIDSVGVVEINSAGAAIGIGSDADNFAINIGTLGTRTISIGSAATTLVLNSTAGDMTLTGTVKQVDTEFTTRSGDQITFQANPVMCSALNTGVAPTGAAGDVNVMMCQEGITMEQFIIGTQTIIAPRMSANGLLVSLDLTVAEGAEYNFGAARLNSRHAYTIGTSPAFFFELEFRIADMDGADPYIFGFRKVEANNADNTAYTDYATMGMIAGTSATQIVLSTELNGGGNTITNTLDLWGGDGTTNTLTVLVSAAGVVTYLVNGIAPSVTAAFTFDGADVVVPFIHLVHSATPSAVDLVSMKIGYQA